MLKGISGSVFLMIVDLFQGVWSGPRYEGYIISKDTLVEHQPYAAFASQA